MLRLTVTAALAALLLAACTSAPPEPPPAAAQDPVVAEGQSIVEMYCADCHATGPTGESPLDIAPRFRDLHERYDVELLSEALVEGIVTAHPEMPEFEFDPDQAEAVIQYLKSLEPKPSP